MQGIGPSKCGSERTMLMSGAVWAAGAPAVSGHRPRDGPRVYSSCSPSKGPIRGDAGDRLARAVGRSLSGRCWVSVHVCVCVCVCVCFCLSPCLLSVSLTLCFTM